MAKLKRGCRSIQRLLIDLVHEVTKVGKLDLELTAGDHDPVASILTRKNRSPVFNLSKLQGRSFQGEENMSTVLSSLQLEGLRLVLRGGRPEGKMPSMYHRFEVGNSNDRVVYAIIHQAHCVFHS
jgi:hypothetical protein